MDTVPDPTLGRWTGGLLDGWRLDVTAADLDRPLDDLVARIGEPAFAAIVLALEATLPEPFPEDLLAQIETLRDLMTFAAVKRSRLSPTPTDERRHAWSTKHDTGP